MDSMKAVEEANSDQERFYQTRFLLLVQPNNLKSTSWKRLHKDHFQVVLSIRSRWRRHGGGGWGYISFGFFRPILYLTRSRKEKVSEIGKFLEKHRIKSLLCRIIVVTCHILLYAVV